MSVIDPVQQMELERAAFAERHGDDGRASIPWKGAGVVGLGLLAIGIASIARDSGFPGDIGMMLTGRDRRRDENSPEEPPADPDVIEMYE